MTISREEALTILNYCDEYFHIEAEHEAFCMARNALKERSHGNWEYLKEHITEMRDADGELNQKDTCQFILNLMGVIEREGDEK